jgi:hypothetical protein
VVPWEKCLLNCLIKFVLCCLIKCCDGKNTSREIIVGCQVRSELSVRTQTESCWSERNPFELVLLLQILGGRSSLENQIPVLLLLLLLWIQILFHRERESERERGLLECKKSFRLGFEVVYSVWMEVQQSGKSCTHVLTLLLLLPVQFL